MKTFENVSSLKLANIKAGQLVNTKGYYAPGDGGQAVYFTKTTEVVDEFGNFTLANGNVAVLQLQLDTISAQQFGAKGDGVTNDSPPIQAAINFANGQRVIELAHASYVLEEQIDAFVSVDEVTIYQKTTAIVGAGQEKTTIINRTGTNWLIHKPTVTGASNSLRMVGFKLNDMTVKTDGSSPAGSAGPLIYSAWQGECKRYFSTAMFGNGFDIPLDNALNANVDRYSCGYFVFDEITILSSEGIGVNLGNGSTTIGLYNFYIVGNKLGGVFMTGNSNNVNLGSIAGNGEDAGTAGYGIHSAYSVELGAPHNNKIMNVEVDNNWGRDIIIDGYQNRIECRIVQNGTLGAGGNTFRATDMLFFNSFVSFGARNNNAKCLFRVDEAGTAALNIVTTTDTVNTDDNHIDGTFAISGGGSNVIKANLLGTTTQRNTVSEKGGVFAASVESVKYDKNKLFLINGASLALNIVAAKLEFTAAWDAAGLWDLGNDDYTAPHAGLLTISYCGPFRAIIANDGFNIFVKVNTITTNTIEFAQGLTNTAGSEYISFNVTVPVEAGDKVELWANSVSNSGVFFIGGIEPTTRFIME